MLVRMLKAHWFPLAIILLVLVAIYRKYRPVVEVPDIDPIAHPERYTEREAVGDGTARLGLFSSGTARVRMPAPDPAVEERFLRRFSRVAIGERKKFGVPASILLAHACVNSFAGTRSTVALAGNYTGLGCGAGWDGPTLQVDGRCLRQYETAWESYRDFSLYLLGTEWWPEARRSNGSDPSKWIKTFQRHQLTDVENYAEEMSRVMEAYRLYELDK